MIELVQQLAVLDALLSNWDGVLIRMGPSDPLRQKAMVILAERLSRAVTQEAIDPVIDDLFDLVEDTPAYDYVRHLIGRAQLGPETVAKTRSRYVAERPSPDEIGMVSFTAGLAGQSLGKAIAASVEPCLVDVYFVTNRKSNENGSEGFSGEPDEDIHYGVAEVTIPVGAHRTGRLEQRKWWQLLSDRDDPRRYVVLGHIDTLSEGVFSSRLAIDTELSGDLLIFLHGYNVTFEDAARRAAQFAFDMQFAGPVVLFSWPSQGSLLGYLADEERALLSGDRFASFLRSLEQGPWKRVHMLAHSMGNRVMLYGLAGGSWPNLKLGQIVFVAADVYVEIFRQFFPKIRKYGHLYTSYASKNDRALLMSSFLHKADRIGIIKGEPFVTEGMETIDATKADTSSLGHGYFADDNLVIKDISALIGSELTASRRGLCQPPAKIYWDLISEPSKRN
ncbi:MAG: alpha/beta hydrolase [Pseudomonadota bacterium]